MTQVLQNSQETFFVCGIDLTLPHSFVRQWIALTEKQCWTAKIRDYATDTDDPVETVTSVGEKGISRVFETDVAMMTDFVLAQQTYLCAHITGAQFCVKEGRLQLTVVDVKAKSGNTEQDFRKCSPSEAKPVVLQSSQSHDAQVVQADCSGEVVLQTLPELTSELGNECDEDCTADETPREDYQTREQVGTLGNHDNLQAAVPKRKRGRPRKNATRPAGTAHGIADDATDTSKESSTAIAEPHPPITGRYSLRGKKLPRSIFGDSGSEQEEDHEDEEYQPPSKKFDCLKTVGTEHVVKVKAGISEKVEAVREEVVVDSTGPNQTDCQETNSGNFTESNSLAQNVPPQHEENVKENSASTSAVPHKKKRGRPSRVASGKTTSMGKRHTKKKRMKIDVTGLPSFSRRVRNKDRKATCKYCRRKFCDFTGVTMHVKKFHSKMDDLKDYLEELKRLSVVKCSICDKEFDNRFQLQLHEDKVHYKAGTLPCKQCGKTFSNMVLVKQHIRSVHQVQAEGHTCTLCSARFKWTTSMKAHIAEVHHGIRDLECKVCGKKFHRQAQLNRHAIIHGPEEAKLACKLCGRKFWYANNLQRHMSIIHGPQEELWHCAYCGKGFQRKESLNNHLEKLHFSLFPYHCTTCRAGFVRSVLLEKHMASEHGVLDFQAPTGRRTHFKYNRSEQDELSCGVCNSKFFYKSQLVQHILSAHKDVFPFHCDVCQQVFMEKSFLVLHRKRAHAIEPGPEDAEFDMETDSLIQQNFPVSGPVRGNRRRKTSLSHLTKRKGKDIEENTLPIIGENSYIIKVEKGNSTIQYVIQNPEGGNFVSSEAAVQDIASLLLAAEQSMQEEDVSQGIVLQSVSDGSGPTALQNIIVTEPDSVQSFQENESQQSIQLATQVDDTLQGLTMPQRIVVQCGENSMVQTVPNTVEVEVESTGEQSASNPDGLHDFSFLASSLNADAVKPGRVLVTGGSIVQNLTVSPKADVSEHILSPPSGKVGQQPQVDYTACTADTNTEPAVYVAVESLPSSSLAQCDNVAGIPTQSDVQAVAMETVPANSVVEHLAVNSIPGSVVLDAADVFGSAGFNQQIIVTTMVDDDDDDGVILSAKVDQDQQM